MLPEINIRQEVTPVRLAIGVGTAVGLGILAEKAAHRLRPDPRLQRHLTLAQPSEAQILQDPAQFAGA